MSIYIVTMKRTALLHEGRREATILVCDGAPGVYGMTKERARQHARNLSKEYPGVYTVWRLDSEGTTLWENYLGGEEQTA